MSTKNMIIVIIITILGALIFWKRDYIRSRFKKSNSSLPNTNNTNAYNSLPSTAPISYKECKTFPLKIGCKGKNVETIQKALNKLHKVGLKEDGYFGPKTENALLVNGYGITVEKEDMTKMINALKTG